MRTYSKARVQLELPVASLAKGSVSNLLISALFQSFVMRNRTKLMLHWDQIPDVLEKINVTPWCWNNAKDLHKDM